MYPFASRLALTMLFFTAVAVLGAQRAAPEGKRARAAQPADASMPYVPAIWVMLNPNNRLAVVLQLGSLPDYSFKKVAVRGKQLANKALMEEFPRWQQIFKRSHQTDIAQAELLSFILQLDPYWEKGANRAAILAECRQKLGYLPAEAVRTWQKALSKKAGSTANRLTVAGFLLQSAQINPDCKFDVKKSTLMLDRLNALPADAIKSWQHAIKLDSHQAAMSIIESNVFFDDANRFKDEPFRKAVETRKEVPLAKAEPPAAKPATPEEKADQLLAGAKEVLEAKNVLLARIRLRRIVAEYAKTPAAVEAERLLKTLPK